MYKILSLDNNNKIINISNNSKEIDKNILYKLAKHIKEKNNNKANITEEDNKIIIDKNKQEHVLLGIFLLIRGRQEVVLGVVVDHGLCENLVLLAALEILQVFLHCFHCLSFHKQRKGSPRPA